MPEAATKQKIGQLQHRAAIDPATINEEARTFDVVFATETEVFRRGWDEDFYEILSCDKGSIRAERLDAGAVPLLDNHNGTYGSVRGQMGRIVGWSVEGKKCRATVKFSAREENKGIWEDIREGVIGSISVGYRVWKLQLEEKSTDGKLARFRASDWEPMEISLVSIPADYNASVRAADGVPTNDVQIIRNDLSSSSTPNMETENTTTQTQTGGAEGAEKTGNEATPPAQGQRSADAPASTPTNNAPATEGAPTAEAVRAAERQRATDITEAVRKAGLDLSFAGELIAKDITTDAARTAIIDKMGERAEAAGGIRSAGVVGEDETVQLRNAMADGLMARAVPGSVDLSKADARAHDFRHSTMLDLAKSCLRRTGENPDRFSPSEVVKRAIATTDYPNLLTSVIRRTLLRYYGGNTVQEWKRFGRQVPASDFREVTGVKVDGNVTFSEMAEGMEYSESKLLTDETAKLKLKTFGRQISITRQAIINDDLGVFNRLPQMLALGARRFQSKKFWDLILGNAKAPDGVALFHTATHKNLAGTGVALSSDSLSAARVAMRRQKSPEGEELYIVPRYLLIPAELETKAAQLLTAITANTTSEVNVWAGKLEPVVVDYLTDPTAWYLAADPNEITAEGLVYAYLDGQEGLYTETETDFNTDVVRTKARLDFDAAVWGYQGWYKNPGAA